MYYLKGILLCNMDYIYSNILTVKMCFNEPNDMINVYL